MYISSVDNPKAVVILLGWVGAKKRHLEKFVEVYTKEHGCSVVYGNASVVSIMFYRHGALARVAMDAIQKTARILREEQENIRNDGGESTSTSSSGRIIPVVLHHFSNGGAMLAEKMDLMIKDAKRLEAGVRKEATVVNADETEDKQSTSNGYGSIRHISRSNQPDANRDCLLIYERLHAKGFEILDSAPAFISKKSVNGALEGAIPNKILQIPVKVLLSIAWFLTFLLETVCCRERMQDVYWNKMLTSELCQRQAFVYSSIDEITDPLKLEEFMEVRMKRGVDVHAHKFEDSDHVAHFKKYPEEYRSIIDSVLKRCEDDVRDDTIC
mmetsp:Transcript_4738/g.6635  ORF Transcript_4738/g.6635 Transcript_4738/m.6635 type:complete len:327 (+) Transcript_4738:121-1101(+)|eukprot:CAMPEP_0194091870 /NCGR_PEP_ID=MMETSP0149-20130528/44827_1 /TAXON_ID=122233 /ORGANISM="Chaetoceros debilis, Strain MM31A-1" /LENGTH=326 /DNA_ID=CAMNT_0038776633 /DNA_START=53 /DNA_END=1033 /DNA_ORIENTATION=+